MQFEPYRSSFEHPDSGLMLNKTLSAKHLGVSTKKFERIAPGPEVVQQGIYPFWSKRVLDILPTTEIPTPAEVFEQGRACGRRQRESASPLKLAKVREELLSLRLGSRVLVHTCGNEEATSWPMHYCSCPKAPLRDVVAFILGCLVDGICARTDRETQWFIEGFASTTRPQ